ncbi:MAG TPA: methyltransferase domain-containing protein [Ktedonobacteraceae bacterium]|nr:methyltransferase domain-containing protein [Ktedonobacteraceae bacterium]
MFISGWWFRRRKSRQAMKTQEQQQSATLTETEQRTYLADTPYLLPKDALEDQRLNFQHHVLYRTLSNHYLAPISPTTATILDVGTGTGIWPIEMASLFPHAHILGIDVSLTSLPHTLPPTCLFSQANILQGLPFPDQQFDFTHQRLLVAAIPAACWPAVVRELVRVTRVGGWIELLEIGDTIQNAGPATKRLLTWMTSISQELGFEMAILRRLGDLLSQAGCLAIEAQDIPVPLGEWAGTTGQMLKTDVLHGYHALKDSYCLRSHTPPEAFDTMLQNAAAEWERLQSSYIFHATYGRRGQA